MQWCASRARNDTYDTVRVLQRLWLVSGQPCGKYLGPVMAPTVETMENHPDSTLFGKEAGRYGPAVRAQLLAMSLATIDQLLPL